MRRVRVGAVLAVTLVLVSGCALRLQNASGLGGVDGPTYRVTAIFDELARLPRGGGVRMGQARAGRVADVTARDFRALVHMEIAADTELPVGTRARLVFTSALGEQQVVLRPPERAADTGELADGAVIPARHTSAGPDVEQALAAVGAVVNGSGFAQARTILDEVSTALHGRTDDVRQLLARLDTALGALRQQRGAITSLIDSLHDLSGRLATNRSTLDSAVTRISPALDVLLSQRESFVRLLDSVSSLAASADGLLERGGDALTGAVRDVTPMLRNLRGIDDRLGTVLRKMREFDGLLRRAAPGDYLLLDGTLDVPHSLRELLTVDLTQPDANRGGIRELLEGATR